MKAVFLAIGVLSGVATVADAATLAGAYPLRPIRFVVPFPAGGGVDIVTRILAKEMAEKLGQQVVVDNRAGASGVIGTQIVANSSPDGYTLLMGNVATHAVNVNLFKKLPYDPLKDFAPICLVARVPGILLVHPSVPANSIQELIALAKSKPGQLVYGSAGNGTPTHLAAELFKSLAGVNIVHIPYKGTPPALADLIGGQITMMFSNIVSGLPMVKAGKAKGLGVTSLKRASIAPDIPAISESGLPGFQEESWYGALAPLGTPLAVVARLNATIMQVLNSPAILDRFVQQGAEIVPGSPGEFREFIRSEILKYARIVKDSGLRIE